ncbi:SLC13 family permease [Desulfitobacterium hafniense]|uniref:SLC13 family permease n=1 Tax=Desulfitobacterium hafniense TaxID=49338 RepID=UPI00036DEC24|nr:SLC13 family permease [Desulfitobacterium hafniense]
MDIITVTVLAIVVAVLLGFVTKINIGLYAFAFSYLIGCYGLGMTPKAVTALLPTQIFYLFFAVTFFYSFATEDGTLELISKKAIYATRKVPVLLPFVILLISGVLAAMGAGLYAILALMVPVGVSMAQTAGIHPFLGGITAAYGASIGSNFRYSSGGVIINGLITNDGYDAASAMQYTDQAFFNMAIIYLILTVILFFFFKGYQVKAVDVEKPAPFNKKQKANLVILLCVIVVVILPALLEKLLPNVTLIAMMSKYADIGFVATIASVVVLALKLGDAKVAFAKVPWATLITICGVSTLMGVATQAGVIDALTAWVSANVAPFWIPAIVMLTGCSLSVFGSGYGVVMPTLFPMVPALALAAGVDPGTLYSVTVLSAFLTGVSPFSSGGGLIQAGVHDDVLRAKFFNWQLIMIAVGLAAGLLYTYIIIL